MPRSRIVRVKDGKRYSLCPQCKVVEVECRTSHGTAPRCDDCLAQNRKGRNERARMARAVGQRLNHHDANGVRYEVRKRWRTCSYCGNNFLCKRVRALSASLCDNPTCMSDHRKAMKQRKDVASREDRVRENHRRLIRRLTDVGKTLDWYRENQACSICQITRPGAKGWAFDHSHKCCPRGCDKCFRGLLCSSCNMGLGMFRDEPQLLHRAINYLNRLF